MELLLDRDWMLWDALDTDNFYFILFYFSNFILILFLFLFYFYFGWWRGTWHRSHMTCHMMWYHRPRTWWKNLEDDIRTHVYNMVVKTVDGGLYSFLFSLFYLIFLFFYFLFSIFRTTQVRGYQSRCHISHKLMA